MSALEREEHEMTMSRTGHEIGRAPGHDEHGTRGAAAPPAVAEPVANDVTTPVDRLAGGVLAGVLAGAAMYAVLAGSAIAQGRSALYPTYAVEAMMTGRRVLPDHPFPNLEGRHPADFVLGPVMFLLPAVAVAVIVSWWVGRSPRARAAAPANRPPGPGAALLPTIACTAGLFVVLILLLGFHESDGAVQRLSSGYGVRQLGVWAWLVAHAVYVAALSLALRPVVGAVSRVRQRRRRPVTRIRGE